MITDFFLPAIEEYDLDGATCHTTLTNMALMQETFPGRVIVRRSYAKNRVYADKLSTLEHLKTNIRHVMAEVPPNMCQKVVENYIKRINALNTWRGDHLNDVVSVSHIMSTFKMYNKTEIS